MGPKRQTIVILIASTLACAMAEVGDSLEESVKKHGQPMGRIVLKDQVAYIFSISNSMVREVYNLEGKCIESDFWSPAKQVEEPVTVTPVEILLEPTEPEPIESARSKWWYLLLLIPVCGFAAASVWYFSRRKKDASSTEDSSSENTESDPDFRTNTPETSLRLSRNEMCFYKALSEAVQGQYIITFHLLLDRIIDFDDPAFAEDLPVFNELKPIAVDFVLHHLEDSSISAVILLTGKGSDLDQKMKRVKLIQNVMNKNKTPFIQIPENYQYDSSQILNIIKDNTPGSAA